MRSSSKQFPVPLKSKSVFLWNLQFSPAYNNVPYYLLLQLLIIRFTAHFLCVYSLHDDVANTYTIRSSTYSVNASSESCKSLF